jgi:integrase
VPVAKVSRLKRSSKGTSGTRTVPAVPPKGWPVDCFQLVRRWNDNCLPADLVTARLTRQMARLRTQAPVTIALDPELTCYGCRHAFALRLGLELRLHPREAAELMGHSPLVHLQTYGHRI